jgi:hypothetical protein
MAAACNWSGYDVDFDRYRSPGQRIGVGNAQPGQWVDVWRKFVGPYPCGGYSGVGVKVGLRVCVTVAVGGTDVSVGDGIGVSDGGGGDSRDWFATGRGENSVQALKNRLINTSTLNCLIRILPPP